MSKKAQEDQFSEAETQRRLEAIMRGAFSGPPKTYEESKVGKRRGKAGKSPGPRKQKSQAKKTAR